MNEGMKWTGLGFEFVVSRGVSRIGYWVSEGTRWKSHQVCENAIESDEAQALLETSSFRPGDLQLQRAHLQTTLLVSMTGGDYLSISSIVGDDISREEGILVPPLVERSIDVPQPIALESIFITPH